MDNTDQKFLAEASALCPAQLRAARPCFFCILDVFWFWIHTVRQLFKQNVNLSSGKKGNRKLSSDITVYDIIIIIIMFIPKMFTPQNNFSGYTSQLFFLKISSICEPKSKVDSEVVGD